MRYFEHITQLNNAGGVNLRRLEKVATFLNRNVLVQPFEVSEQQILAQILEYYRKANDQSNLAELSLRCLISHYIHQACDRLAQQFGHRFVLDDVGDLTAQVSKSSYQPLSNKILQSFDAQRGSLKSWTEQLVKQHPEIKEFLKECGLCLISDWALLNQATLAKLKRIYCELVPRTPEETQELCEVLAIYHQVYRSALIQARQKGQTGICPPPTEIQLRQMIEQFSAPLRANFSDSTLYQALREIARHLREDMLAGRQGPLSSQSLDDPSFNPGLTLIEEDSSSSPYQDWLRFYRTELSACLASAIQTVVSDRLQHYSEQKGEKFLIALQLFHCQALSMAYIAEKLGFKAQFQVSRFLKLKDLREDIRIRLLQCLTSKLKDSAYELASPKALAQFDHQLQTALAQQVDELIQQAQAETKTAKEQWSGTLFARMLCSVVQQIAKTQQMAHGQ